MLINKTRSIVHEISLLLGNDDSKVINFIFRFIYFHPIIFGMTIFVILISIKQLISANSYVQHTVELKVNEFNILVNTLLCPQLDKFMIRKCLLILSAYPEAVNMPISESLDAFNVFQQACQHNSPELITFMLNCGANINSSTKNNVTPFHIATLYIAVTLGHDFTILNILLSAGAEINNKRGDGFTCLQIAELHGNNLLCEWLLTNGATR